jgi:hypothetical protein
MLDWKTTRGIACCSIARRRDRARAGVVLGPGRRSWVRRAHDEEGVGALGGAQDVARHELIAATTSASAETSRSFDGSRASSVRAQRRPAAGAG